MPEWIHSVLIGGLIGLFFVAREIEKWGKKRQSHLKELCIAKAEYERKIAIEHKKRLHDELEEIREKLRLGLQGIWSTAETIPIGCSFEFLEDGVGLMIDYRGMGGWEIPFQWRSVGDWSIEIKFDFPQEYLKHYNDVSDPENSDDLEAEAEDENEWDRIDYDFIVAPWEYPYTCIVLCSAHDAQRFERSPAVINDFGFGFWMCEGPLILRSLS